MNRDEIRERWAPYQGRPLSAVPWAVIEHAQIDIASLLDALDAAEAHAMQADQHASEADGDRRDAVVREESLRAALVKYGAHWRNCSYMEGRCSCGFRDATLTKE